MREPSRPLSGRTATYPPVRIPRASSGLGQEWPVRQIGWEPVIDHGRLAYDGSLDALRATVDADRILIVDLARPAPPIEVDGASVVRTDGPRQWLAIPSAVNAAAVVAAVAGRHEVEDISLREPGIEDLITRLYRGGVPAGH